MVNYIANASTSGQPKKKKYINFAATSIFYIHTGQNEKEKKKRNKQVSVWWLSRGSSNTLSSKLKPRIGQAIAAQQVVHGASESAPA